MTDETITPTEPIEEREKEIENPSADDNIEEENEEDEAI